MRAACVPIGKISYSLGMIHNHNAIDRVELLSVPKLLRKMIKLSNLDGAENGGGLGISNRKVVSREREGYLTNKNQ